MTGALSKIEAKYYAARHKLMARGLSGIAPYYVVNEFPKSGGTWLAQMLSDALEIPFRRNTPIRFERSVTHGHFLSPLGLRNTVVMWRDPRDVIVSFYYHSYFVNEHNNAGYVAMMKLRQPFSDYNDIEENLPIFIKNLTLAPVSPQFTWTNFAKVWANRSGIVQSSYEALRADTPKELGRVLESLTGAMPSQTDLLAVAAANSLEKAKEQAKQLITNAEVSFVREGSLGGWRKHFSAKAQASFRDYGYLEYMQKLGYSVTP